MQRPGLSTSLQQSLGLPMLPLPPMLQAIEVLGLSIQALALWGAEIWYT